MVSLHSHAHTYTHKKKRLYSDWDKQWFKMHTSTLAILLKKHGPCQTKKNKSKPSPKEKQTGPHMAPYNCYRTSPKSNYFFTHWLLQTSRGNLRKQDDTGGERKKQTTAAEAALPRDTVAHQSHMCGLFASAHVQRAKWGQNNRCLSKARCWFPASLCGIAVRWRKIVYICRLENFFRLTSCQWKCACDRICMTPVSAPWSSYAHSANNVHRFALKYKATDSQRRSLTMSTISTLPTIFMF